MRFTQALCWLAKGLFTLLTVGCGTGLQLSTQGIQSLDITASPGGAVGECIDAKITLVPTDPGSTEEFVCSLTADSEGFFFRDSDCSIAVSALHFSASKGWTQSVYLQNDVPGQVSFIASIVDGGETLSATKTFSQNHSVFFISSASNIASSPQYADRGFFSVGLVNGEILRLSTGSDSSQMPCGDGPFGAFQALYHPLIASFGSDCNGSTEKRSYLKNLSTDNLIELPGLNADNSAPSVSNNGSKALFNTEAGLVGSDTNAQSDVYILDLNTGSYQGVSVDSGGNFFSAGVRIASNGSLSADGKLAAFWSAPWSVTSPPDHKIHLRDLDSSFSSEVDVSSSGVAANGNLGPPILSGNGKFIVFVSDSDNLVPNDTNGAYDVFVKDLASNATTRVSVGSNGVEANGNTEFARISFDGKIVVFASYASNLVAGDTNSNVDIFVHDRTTSTTTRISESLAGIEGNNHSLNPNCYNTCRYVAFESTANNLVPDGGPAWGIFLYDRVLRTLKRITKNPDGTQFNQGAFLQRAP